MKVYRKTKPIKILWSILALLLVASVFLYIIARQVSLKSYNANLLSPSLDSTIYYASGEEMSFEGVTEIPELVKNAFVAIEDKRFYRHSGVDYVRLAGAAIDNIKSGSRKEGGSTISQQLIKNTHLSSSKTYSRKVKEFFLAKQLERDFSKDDILTMYLHAIYFGKNLYGIKSAAKGYFNKSVGDLSLEEGALLAAIINSPAVYSPLVNMDKALKRRNQVLVAMQKNGFISSEECESALKTEIIVNESEVLSATSVLQRVVLEECRRIVGDVGAVEIFTSIDKSKQELLANALANPKYQVSNVYGKMPDNQAIIINNRTGEIEAYHANSHLAYHAQRQPASAIKPILVYAPALEDNLVTPASLISDTAINIEGYSPKNPDNKFHGAVSARNCLAQSLNVPSVRLLQAVGIERAKSFAKRAGVSFSSKDNGYAIALGGFYKGITLRQTANTYQAIANRGKYIESGLINEIRCGGYTLYKKSVVESVVMRQDTAFLLCDMLKTGAESGTSFRLRGLPFEVAAKTGTAGTARGNTDAYSIASTSEHTVGVWQGELGGGMMNARVSGGTTPTKICKEILQGCYSTPPAPFAQPSSVVKIKVDADALKNGAIMLADHNSTHVETEFFSRNNMPNLAVRTINLPRVTRSTPSPTTNRQMRQAKKPLYHTIKRLIKPIKW